MKTNKIALFHVARSLRTFLFFLFLTVGTASVAQPPPPGCPDVLDQQQTSFNSGSAGVDQWQSFTAATTGKLSRIDFETNSCPAYTYTLTIYSGQGTGGSVLYSGTFTNPGICNNWCTAIIPIGSAPGISATAQYTFRMQSATTMSDVVNSSNVYGGGIYYSSDYGVQNNWDLMFRVFTQQTSYPPASITPGGPTTFCQGGNVILTASAGSFTYQWWNGASAIGGATSQNYSATIPGVHAVVVTNTSTNCWNVSNQINVIVNPLPVATASNATICATGIASLSATPSGGTPSYTYGWFSVPTGGTALVTTGTYNTPPLSPAGTYTYYPQVTDANGCVSIRPLVTVLANPLPSISVSGGPVSCFGGTANLTATGATTYTWQPGSIPGAAQTLSAGSYTVAGTLNGCVNTTPVNLTQPSSPLSVSFSGGTTVCSGAALNLTLSGNGGTGPYSFQWLAASNPNTSGQSATSVSSGTVNDVITNLVSTPQVITYTLTVTDNNSCTATQTVNVTVNPAPSMTSATSTAVCSGVTMNFPLSANLAGTTYAWLAVDNSNTTGESLSTQTPSSLNNTIVSSSPSPQVVPYTITPTSAAGCVGSNQSVFVTVNPAPVITSANSVGICSGMTLAYTITSNQGGGTFTWIATDNTNTVGESLVIQNTGTINNTITSSSSVAQNVSYTITPTSSLGCAGAPFTFITSVNPLPAMTSANTAVICSGATVNIPLSSNISSTYTWIAGNNPNTTGESTALQTTGILNNSISSSSLVPETVTYTVTPSAGGCLGPVQIVTVTVNPIPAMTSSSGFAICSGVTENFPLSSNVPSNYNWIAADNLNTTGESLTTQSSSTINNTVVSSAVSPQNISYTVTPVSLSGCTGAPQTVNVAVNPTPAMSSPSSGVICSGVPISFPLNSTVAGSYSWIASDNSNTSGESLTAQSNSVINNTILSSTVNGTEVVSYTVTPTSGAGCAGNPQTVNITVNPAPVMTSASTKTICSGSAVGLILVSSVISNYSWVATDNASTTGESVSAQTASTLNDNIVSSALSAVVVQYTVTPTSQSGGCLGTPQTVNVTVNPKPNITSSNSTTICSGTSVGLGFASDVSSTYSWIATNNASTTGESTSLQSTSSLTDNIVSSATSAVVVQYTITPISLAGCAGNPQSLNVTVNPAPTMSSPSSATICSGGAENIPLTSVVPSAYSWIAADNANTSGESLSSQSSATINNTIISSNTGAAELVSYTVTPTSGAGCTGTPQALLVTVNPAPVMTSAASGTICSGGTESIPLSSSVSSSYSWIASDNANTSGESTSSQSSSTINNTVVSSSSVAEIVSYTVTPTSSLSCVGAPQTVLVTVNPAPNMTSATSATICSGNTVNLSLSSDIAATYSWIALDNASTIGESISSQTASIISDNIISSATVAAVVQYNVTPTSGAGCAGAMQTVNITVNPTPAMNSAASATICSGNAVNMTLTSAVASSYSWIAADNANTTGESSSSQSSSTITDNIISSTTTAAELISYTVSPTSLAGCPGTPQTIVVMVNPAPMMTSTNSTTTCSGVALSIPLTSSAPASYSWVAADNANTTGESLSNQSSTTIGDNISSSSLAAELVSYTVSPTSLNGCPGTPQTVLVTVNPAPTMTSANTAGICSGNAINLVFMSDIASNFTWLATDNINTTGESLSNQSSGTLSDVVTSSVASTQTISYTVIPTSQSVGCTGASQTINITVDPTPVMTSSSSGTVCSGLTPGLPFSSSVSSTYSWLAADNMNTSGESTVAQTSSTLNDLITSSSAVAEIISYTVTPTSTGGCAGVPQTISITVNPAPLMTSANSATICSGNAVNLSLTSNIPATYSWLAADNINTTGESTAAQLSAIISDNISSSAAVLTTVSYTVTPSSGAGCAGAPQIISVDVNPIPVLPTASNTSICNGATASLTATAPGGTYDWFANSSGGASLFTGATFVTPALSSSTTYFVQSTMAGCIGNRTPVTVTVNPNPAFSINAPATICSGEDLSFGILSLGGGSSFTYNWSGPGSFSSALPNPIRTAVLISHGGSYSVGITNEFGCTTNHSVSITVLPSPTAHITGPSSICTNEVATLSGATSTANGDVISGYQWIQGSTAIAGATSVSYATSTAGNYFLEVTNSNGCKDTTLVSPLLANAIPSAIVGGPTAFCSGSSFTLNGSASAAGGTSTISAYEWLLGGTTVSGVVTNNGVFSAGGGYQLVLTNSNGCKDTSAVYNVTMNTAPTVSAGADAAVCAGAPYILTASGTAASYTWNNGVSNGVSFVPTATLSYVVTGTGSNTCTNTDTVIITVNALPVVGINTIGIPACAGSSVTLSGTGAVSYSWSGGISDGVSFIPSGSVTYTVTGADANGCTNTASQPVMVNALPNVTAGASSNNVCPGTSVTLNAGGATSYLWNGGQTQASFSFIPAVTATYTVTGTDANSCTNTAMVTVTLLPQPPTPTALSGVSSVCSGISVSLTSSSATNNNWFSSVSPAVIISTAQNFSHTESVAGTYSYGLFVLPAGGCSSDTAYATVTFTNCLSSLNNELIQLFTNASGSGNVLSNDGNPAGYAVNTTPLQNALNGSFSISSTGAYTYTPNSGFSGYDRVVVQACDASPNCLSDTIFIVVSPLANFDFGTVSGLIANATLTGNVLTNDAGTGIAGNASLLVNVTAGTLVFSANGDFTYTPTVGYCGADSFKYQVCDVNGLCSFAYCTIDVNCDVNIQTHTGFSPNNDGVNDKWVIDNIGLEENDVSLYDRWGNEIWRGHDYDNNKVVWDGRNKNGEELPAATYFFMIELKDKAPMRGWVELTK